MEELVQESKDHSRESSTWVHTVCCRGGRKSGILVLGLGERESNTQGQNRQNMWVQ